MSASTMEMGCASSALRQPKVVKALKFACESCIECTGGGAEAQPISRHEAAANRRPGRLFMSAKLFALENAALLAQGPVRRPGRQGQVRCRKAFSAFLAFFAARFSSKLFSAFFLSFFFWFR